MTVYPARSKSLPSHFATKRDEVNFVYEAGESDSWRTRTIHRHRVSRNAPSRLRILPCSSCREHSLLAPVALSSREHNNRKRAGAVELDRRPVPPWRMFNACQKETDVSRIDRIECVHRKPN